MDKTNTEIHNSDIDEGHSDRKADVTQEACNYLNTKMASRELYTKKKIKIGVYPLGNRKYALPRKVV